ncbi:MAG: hypothetical protein LBT79_02015 [Elusimicrobiota bacterium]|jgi:hypothetical protein|nr:hypothetical protein [Elusimicrobiota bacterium]
MTEEEIKALQAEAEKQKAEAEKLRKELEDAKKLIPKQPELPIPPQEKLEDLLAKEKKLKEEQARIEQENKKIESAVRFNYDVEKQVTDNKEIMGEEIATILKLAKERKYPNEIEKANELRAVILNTFFAKQAHREKTKNYYFPQ